MRISIIIPCFKAESCLSRAVSSVRAQSIFATVGHDLAEVVVAADDGGNYNFAKGIMPETRIIPPVSGKFGSGPGATRNRGIRASSGEVLAFLDADDEWSENYLEELIPLVKKHGAAFAQTAILNHNNKHILTLGEGLQTLAPIDFGRWPGSFHPCLLRELSPGFSDGAGQDVFHAIEVLGRVGGIAPVAKNARYKLHLQGNSVTANPQFSAKIARRYRQYINAYRLGETSLEGVSRLKAMQALYRRMSWNQKWLAQGEHRDGFYGFVSENLKITKNTL